MNLYEVTYQYSYNLEKKCTIVARTVAAATAEATMFLKKQFCSPGAILSVVKKQSVDRVAK